MIRRGVETPKPWGCPNCTARSSRVIDTDTDGDGYRIRLRRCTNCGTKWGTEERPIGDKTAFYGRCDRRQDWNWIQRHRRSLTCRFCHGRYRGGGFSAHCRKPSHRAALTTEYQRKSSDADMRARAERQRRAYWLRRYGMEPPPTPAYLRRGDGTSRYKRPAA